MTSSIDSVDFDRAAKVLRDGGLVAFPTETVYGLGADAANSKAVNRIFAVKGRPSAHPLIVHIGAADQLDVWADSVGPVARLLAEAFWPGPLTLILLRSRNVSNAVSGGLDTVGLRVPDHPVALALLETFGGAISAPSANRFGHVSPTTAGHVRADLGDVVDIVLDGGPCAVGVESTIVDLTRGEPEILRPGGVSIDRLTAVLNRTPRVWTGDDDLRPRAPGMSAAHYAPKALVEVVSNEEDVNLRADEHLSRGKSVGVLAPTGLEHLPLDVVELEPAGEPDEYARVLYERLRQADRLGIEILLVIPPPALGVGIAIRDRLRRASA